MFHFTRGFMKNDDTKALTVNHNFYVRTAIDACFQILQVSLILVPIAAILLSIMLGLIQSQQANDIEAVGKSITSTSDGEVMGIIVCGLFLLATAIIFIVYFFSVVGQLRTIHKKITELEDKTIGNTVHKLIV